MHSTSGPSGQTYHHNGDYSGSVKAFMPVRSQEGCKEGPDIACVSRPVKGIDYDNPEVEYVEVSIPFEDIRRLAMWYLMGKVTERLENANDDELERLFLRFGD